MHRDLLSRKLFFQQKSDASQTSNGVSVGTPVTHTGDALGIREELEGGLRITEENGHKVLDYDFTAHFTMEWGCVGVWSSFLQDNVKLFLLWKSL